MFILASIHINKYLVVHECLHFLFDNSYIFLNPGISELFKRISPTICFFYWIEDSKSYAHADANRNPIWHGLTCFHNSRQTSIKETRKICKRLCVNWGIIETSEYSGHLNVWQNWYVAITEVAGIEDRLTSLLQTFDNRWSI